MTARYGAEIWRSMARILSCAILFCLRKSYGMAQNIYGAEVWRGMAQISREVNPKYGLRHTPLVAADVWRSAVSYQGSRSGRGWKLALPSVLLEADVPSLWEGIALVGSGKALQPLSHCWWYWVPARRPPSRSGLVDA